MNWFQQLVATKTNCGITVLRIGLGLAMLPFGLQKMFGWFGGYGYTNTMAFMTGVGIPSFIAFLVIVAEVIGALMIVFGLVTRFAAGSLFVVMVGASIFVAKGGAGYLPAADGSNMGYALMAVLALGYLTLTISGAGSFSLDRLIGKRNS